MCIYIFSTLSLFFLKFLFLCCWNRSMFFVFSFFSSLFSLFAVNWIMIREREKKETRQNFWDSIAIFDFLKIVATFKTGWLIKYLLSSSNLSSLTRLSSRERSIHQLFIANQKNHANKHRIATHTKIDLIFSTPPPRVYQFSVDYQRVNKLMRPIFFGPDRRKYFDYYISTFNTLILIIDLTKKYCIPFKSWNILMNTITYYILQKYIYLILFKGIIE